MPKLFLLVFCNSKVFLLCRYSVSECQHLAHAVNTCNQQTDLSNGLCLRPQAIQYYLLKEIDDIQTGSILCEYPF